MKKILISFILLLLIILTFTGISKAVNSFNVNSIDVSLGSGKYTTGTYFTVKLGLETSVEVESTPTLVIQFGDGETRELETITDIEGLTVTELSYSYTIQSTDSGELKVLELKYNDGTTTDLTGIVLNREIIVNQITWTDYSNATFEWTNYSESNHSYPTIAINNVTLNESSTYYAYMSNEKENISIDTYDWDYDFSANGWGSTDGEEIRSSITVPTLSKAGDIYLWIVEKIPSAKQCRIVLNAQEIERLPQLSLGRRITAYFFNDYTSSYFNEPVEDDSIKINYKIGTITDTSILRAIQNGESNCLERLMEYAKSANNGTTGTISLGRSDTITNNLNLVNDQYYYVYFSLDTENGTYYPVEDVSLYQALVDESVGANLFDYLSEDFKWNIGQNPNNPTNPDDDNGNRNPITDNTIAGGKIPQTGSNIIIGIAVITLLATTGTVLRYKLNKNKDIK